MSTVKEMMPAMLDHAGVWEGTYRHINKLGELIDIHHSRVECVFPEQGEYAYIQHNYFTWDDGREYKVDLSGVLQGDRLFWDTDDFSGYAWQTKDDLIILNLQRKDEVGANFVEMIAMGATKKNRARTWHWFKGGKLYKRTLCDEVKIA